MTILINNAGIVTGKKFLESPDALIEKTVQVNSMAHFWVSVYPVAKLFVLFYGVSINSSLFLLLLYQHQNRQACIQVHNSTI